MICDLTSSVFSLTFAFVIATATGCGKMEKPPVEIVVRTLEDRWLDASPPFRTLEWTGFTVNSSHEAGIVTIGPPDMTAPVARYAYRTVYKKERWSPESLGYYLFAGRDVMEAPEVSELALSLIRATGRTVSEREATALEELVTGIAYREISDGSASLSIYKDLDTPNGISLDVSRRPRGKPELTLDLYLRISDPDPLW
ncbi:hypothetical protein [Phycisphaera mikurensis]|nr:hypothetical protein [Phycisphaera mikurensis]MBB6442304.1 hypothetical protein [Phycisphaera mikurensis]